MAYTRIIRRPTGETLYRKARPLNNAPWTADVVLLTENGTLGEYVAATLDEVTEYEVFVRATATALSSDNAVYVLPIKDGHGVSFVADSITAAAIAADAGTKIAAAVRTDLTTELGRIDVAISTRNAVAPATPTNVTDAQTAIITQVDANKTKIDTIISTGSTGPWTSGSSSASPQLLQTTTIATLASQTSFTLTAGSADDGAYPKGSIVIVTDAATSTQKAVGIALRYTGATKRLELMSDPAVFTMALGDTVSIIAAQSTAGTGGSTLTVTLSDDSAALVAGSEVNLQTTAGVMLGVYGETNASGVVVLTYPDGDYLLKVTDRSGYEDHTAEAVTISGATAKAITVTASTSSGSNVGWLNG